MPEAGVAVRERQHVKLAAREDPHKIHSTLECGNHGYKCRIMTRAQPLAKAGHNDRVTGKTGYPFEPKSIARLQAGQFWAVPLADGRHACGRVLHVPGPGDSLYLNSRTFLAGLMDWSGPEPPASEAIAGHGLLAQGRMHVAAIRDTGSLIIGQRDLELDGMTGLREVSHRGGGTIWLYEGGLRLRPATAEESRTLPVMSVWGRRFIQMLAEKHFPRP